MAAVDNPFKITYGNLGTPVAGSEVGGTSDIYLLHGPYNIDLGFWRLRMVFEVVVVATSYTDLQTRSDALQTAFTKRYQDLKIELDTASWTYTHGTDYLNSEASISKTGNVETDRGYSRSYTIAIEADLPDPDQSGRRLFEMNVDYTPSRQRIVSFRGTYTPHSTNAAVAQYQANFDAEALTLLQAIDEDATWELVDENYTRDRNDYRCDFFRQYVELLESQSTDALAAGIDTETQIRDHRITFVDLSQHPGDSRENTYRMRRVVASYDCAIDIGVITDLQNVYRNKVRAHIIALFQSNFTPQLFTVEDHQLSYDETSKRMSVQLQLLYQRDVGDNIVEVAETFAFREARTIDYTPIHDAGEFTAEADLGWAVLERVSTRTVIVIGKEYPKRRLGRFPRDGEAGPMRGIDDDGNIRDEIQSDGNFIGDGWNIISNQSQVTPQWVGDPDAPGGAEQIDMMVLTETVVERYHEAPDDRTRPPLTPRSLPIPRTGPRP